MSKPERMIDNHEVEAVTMLMLDKLMPTLRHVRDYGREAFPDDDDMDECVQWTNGATGIGATAEDG